MATVGLQILVGGQWLRSRGAWSGLTYSFAFPGGCRDATWTMSAKYSSRLSMLLKGADVQIFWGGWCIWRGYLLEPAWSGSTVTLTANGLSRLGESYPAFDSASTMNPVTNPTTAITTAQGLGLPWVIDASVPNANLTVDTSSDGIYTVSSLMDAWAAQNGVKWYVDQFKVARFAYNPSTPTWVVRNGAGDLGIADDDYASNEVLRYTDSATGLDASVAYPVLTGPMDAYGQRYGRKVDYRDITADAGPITAVAAANYAQQIYTQSKQRPGWTNGLELAHGELVTPGGMPVHPASVDAFARMVRVHGVPDEVALTSYTDFVIGDCSYTDGGATVQINPVGLAARSPETVWTQILNALAAAS